MDFRALSYLLEIAKANSISKAAQSLFMSQSSLSQALRLMEEELGAPLFTRTSTGVRPTQAGALMLQRAEHMLGEYRQMQQIIHDMEHLESGRVSLGISTFRGSYLLPPVLHSFQQRYPKIQVDIWEANSMALEQLLVEGRLDLALVVLPLTKLKGECPVLMRDEMVLVAEREHPISRCVREAVGEDGVVRQYVDLEDTMEFDYILSDHDTMLGSLSRQAFSGLGLVPKVRNGNLTAPFAAAMAKAGLGLAFTYRSCQEESQQVQYYSVGNPGIFLDLGIAFPPGQYRSQAALALGERLRQEFQCKSFPPDKCSSSTST